VSSGYGAIADARKRAGLSQAQLAERIGTKQTGVARMERAGTTGFTTTTLAKIAAATGLEAGGAIDRARTASATGGLAPAAPTAVDPGRLQPA
jgi:transcriptional regulator with XRE-family HTH domain